MTLHIQNGKIISTEVSVTFFNGNHYFARKTRDQFSAPRMSDKPRDRQLVKKGDTFQTLGDMESFIKALETQHHPLKVYKSESIESYNKKVSH